MFKPSSLDFNVHFKKALSFMEDSPAHCLITGKAGTGKSTLLHYFAEHTQKRVAILAPTGVAAVNVGGQTIHSFFRLRPDATPEKAEKTAQRLLKSDAIDLYENLDALIVDEVSMVRADLMDCIDRFLRTVRKKKKIPFGGLKMIWIGDLYQLPPVLRSTDKEFFLQTYPGIYFFDSKVFENLDYERIELETVYRQKDSAFVGLLNAVRNNTLDEKGIQVLNERHKPTFDPGESSYVTLTSTNDQARLINAEKLSRLSGKIFDFHGTLSGDFDRGALPTEEILSLKKGAQVMLLNNDPFGRWVNGTMGQVVSISQEEIRVSLENGTVEEVEPFSWKMFQYGYDGKKKILVSEPVGSFTQYPLKLAWAVTIHKSQGKTFERVIVDVGRGTFANGQMYVALSRATTLEGLVLRKKLLPHHVRVDYRIMKFLTSRQYRASEEAMPLNQKIEWLSNAAKEKTYIEIIYLKAQDEKSRRVLLPLSVGEMEYSGKPFTGLRAHCRLRNEERTFRVDRILEMRRVENL